MLILFRSTEGKLGIIIRYILLKSLVKNIGSNVVIFPNVILKNYENLEIGNNVSIHSMTYIEASGGVKIGNDVSIAHGVTIMSETHNFSRNDIPIKDQGISYFKTVIENNVWIGAKATILAGIIIAEGSIIGASSVVTKNTEKFSTNVGIPAKMIKNRRIKK